VKSYIRGGILEHFADTVSHLGGDTASLLSQADVAPEVLTVPGIFLPYASYLRLMDLAARDTASPHLGLLMARPSNAETLGTIGIIMTQAEHVGAAWETLIHFYRIHDTYGQVQMKRDTNSVMVSYSIPRLEQPGARQVHDVAAGVTANIMRRLCGGDFRAELINFPYSEPADLSPFSDLPAEDIRFGAGAMEVHFDVSYLQQELLGRSEELHSALDDYFARRVGGGRSAVHEVEDMIRRLLPTGDCSLPRIAETLATTPRTLQLKLEAEDSSFRGILEKVRREIATFHLRRGDMQLTQLAMVLGYSELSAFSRSFRAWYGMSPRNWVDQCKNLA
jgi:AraC-like DNA-binding protein